MKKVRILIDEYYPFYFEWKDHNWTPDHIIGMTDAEHESFTEVMERFEYWQKLIKDRIDALEE